MEEDPRMRFSWPREMAAAVSLTFDGGTPIQLDVCRRLEQSGLRATVYADPCQVLERPRSWREAVQSGHELGAHPFFSAADPDGLIARMAPETAELEVRETQDFLAEEFGSLGHSVALPRVRTWPDESGVPGVPEVISRSIVRMNDELAGKAVRSAYPVVRTPLPRFNMPGLDLHEVRCVCMDGLDAVSIGLITQVAISQGVWAVLSWGAQPRPETLAQLGIWLARQPVWVAPVSEVAVHLMASQVPVGAG